MKTNIEVTITEFESDKEYYSFYYTIYVDYKKVDEGQYDNDHSWEDLKAFKSMMLDEYGAVKIALEQWQ